MKIELLFTKIEKNGFIGETLIVAKFRTKKSAYSYVKDNRKFFVHGYFSLFIEKNNDYHCERVTAQDILKV